MKKNIIFSLGIMFLILASLRFTDGFDHKLLKQAFKKDAGAVESLPEEIVSLHTLLKREKIQKFNLTGTMKDNPLLYQRAVEYTYPARLDSSAKDVFAIKGNRLESNCQLVSQLNNVEHYVCK